MSRTNGRACGCDPGADHTCAGHASAQDITEAAFQVHRIDEGGLSSATLTISGPRVDDGDFCIEVPGETIYVSRWVLDAFIDEAQRRLSLRGNAT